MYIGTQKHLAWSWNGRQLLNRRVCRSITDEVKALLMLSDHRKVSKYIENITIIMDIARPSIQLSCQKYEHRSPWLDMMTIIIMSYIGPSGLLRPKALQRIVVLTQVYQPCGLRYKHDARERLWCVLKCKCRLLTCTTYGNSRSTVVLPHRC